MTSLHDTWLWRAAFVESRPDVNPNEQAFFKLHFEAMRDKVKPLVARIMADMPGYTVHDETHLDALWETASLVTPPELWLNPPEAFVFGGAVLLHDAAMTLAAYPGGLADLRKTVTWADTAALAGIKPSPPGAPPAPPASPEIEERIMAEVLRRLHAEKAADLATQGWITSDGEPIHLIEDLELRRFYGPRIGTIAHSHWWPISRVERELDILLGPMPPKTRHGVDLLKIACLLRVADVLHLDRRRAPRFLRALEKPQGLSAQHWAFQEKLAFPQLKDDAVVFTAGEPFSAKEADAWWQAFDAFAAADRELRDADLLLRDWGRHGLSARRVKGADNPEEMVRHIPVSGWRPVETRIRVSDIPKIVETLGGEKLYGDDLLAPVRELLQNSMDAIQARRRLRNRPDWGRIIVELSERQDGIWLVVEDDGIGMSERVLTGALLDFGSSFWRSAQVADEFPGLSAKGMEAIGRFGIGFFSVFMLGDYVRVITRRFDRAESEALTLDFRSGLGVRPILLLAAPGTAPPEGGTRVEVRLWGDPRTRAGLKFIPKGRNPKQEDQDSLFFWVMGDTFRSLAQLVGYVAPASDVTLDAVEFGRRTVAVSARDWLVVPPYELGQRISPGSLSANDTDLVLSNMMRQISAADGTVYGRAALSPASNSGVLTVGGLRIRNAEWIIGIIQGTVTTAARDRGKSLVPPEALSAWATEQAQLIHATDLDPRYKARCAECILEYGGSILSLPVGCMGSTWYNCAELYDLFMREERLVLFVGDVDFSERDEVPRHLFKAEFEWDDRILVIPIVHVGARRENLVRCVRDLIKKAWGDFEEEGVNKVVGRVASKKIIRSTTVYRRLRAAGQG